MANFSRAWTLFSLLMLFKTNTNGRYFWRVYLNYWYLIKTCSSLRLYVYIYIKIATSLLKRNVNREEEETYYTTIFCSCEPRRWFHLDVIYAYTWAEYFGSHNLQPIKWLPWTTFSVFSSSSSSSLPSTFCLLQPHLHTN